MFQYEPLKENKKKQLSHNRKPPPFYVCRTELVVKNRRFFNPLRCGRELLEATGKPAATSVDWVICFFDLHNSEVQ